MSLARANAQGDTKLTLEFVNRPHVVIEEPKRLPVPIIVSRHRRKPRFSRRNWSLRKQSPVKDVFSKKPNKIFTWYAKRKALREFEKEQKKTTKKLKEYEKWKRIDEKRKTAEILDKARREREADVIDYLIKQQKEQAKIEKETREYIERNRERPKREKIKKNKFPTFKRQRSPKVKKQNVIKVEKTYDFDTVETIEKKKGKKIKIQKPYKVPKTPKTEKRKITTVENTYNYDVSPPKRAKREPIQTTVIEETVVPTKKERKVKKKDVKETRVVVRQPETRYIKVKRPHRENFSTRFVNCFYRLCCEFYCWMTIILVVGLTLIFVL